MLGSAPVKVCGRVLWKWLHLEAISNSFAAFDATLALVLLLIATPVHAQYTGNFQTNIISGVVSNWTGDYLIGSNTFADALSIQNGGALSNGNGYVGYEIGADNNMALISDSNSMWNVAGVLVVGNSSSSNQLVVTNGANVACGLLSIGSNSTAGTNTVAVTGTNSLLSVSGDIVIGGAGQMNLLTVGDTAGVVCNNGTIGVVGSSNTVLVTDSGTSWTLSGNLTIGPGGPGNQLVLTNGGGVGTAMLDVQSGTLTLNGGAGTVGSFTVTNGAQSVFTFNGGYLASGATQISNTQPAVIGDGTSTATFQLNGGTHTFVDGLNVLSNAAVTGCGTINGNVTVYPGGVVAANCGGELTFTGIVTNNGDIQVLSGTVLESYGTFVNNGIIDLFDAGPTIFHGAFINNGTIRNGANILISHSDVIIKVTTVVNRLYQLQVTQSLTPANWVNTGPSVPGTGALLTFTDVTGATNRPSRFYRVRLSFP